MTNYSQQSKPQKNYIYRQERLTMPEATGTGIVIPYHKIGSRVFYKQSDIKAYIDNNTFTHTGEVKGLLDTVASSEKNTLNQTREIKGLLDVKK